MSRHDLTLLTDFYELTMMQGYYEKGQNETVIFDVFFARTPTTGATPSARAWTRSSSTSRT